MDDLSRFCCQNEKCADFGKRGTGQLSVCDHYGPRKQRRMLYCLTCKSRFSERKGTALFGCHLPEEKIQKVFAHLQEGCGVRKTSRLVGVTANTVVRLSAKAGQHARQTHDELVAFSPADPRAAVR